jgi:1-acyl-sn-glycerol-3-phosphate acyltransferase
MLSRIERGLRVLASAIAFTLFGLGSLIISLTIFPALHVIIRDPARRWRVARGIIRLLFRMFLAIMQSLRIMTVSLAGLEELRRLRGAVIVSNHPTLIDVILIIAAVPRPQCVVKNALWRNPFLAGVVSAAGFIPNDQEPEAFVSNCVASLQRGDNLIIFPEGTRSGVQGLRPFSRSFANIALAAKADIQCLIITCEPLILSKEMSWADLGERRSDVRLVMGDRFEAGRYSTAPRSTAARRLVESVQGYYVERLSHAYG